MGLFDMPVSVEYTPDGGVKVKQDPVPPTPWWILVLRFIGALIIIGLILVVLFVVWRKRSKAKKMGGGGASLSASSSYQQYHHPTYSRAH